MAEEEITEEGAEEPPKKKSKKGLLIGLILALALGGGGFFAAYSGLVGGAAPTAESVEIEEETPVLDLPAVAFINLDPMVISLGDGGSRRHLRFRSTLEVAPQYEADVAQLTPRVLDVLNSYLRAVDMKMLSDPKSLVQLRAQMLRRIKLVTGEGRVRDLLIIEFVLN